MFVLQNASSSSMLAKFAGGSSRRPSDLIGDGQHEEPVARGGRAGIPGNSTIAEPPAGTVPLTAAPIRFVAIGARHSELEDPVARGRLGGDAEVGGP